MGSYIAELHIDLRWNHAGLVGGQALVDMMHKNKVIQRVETKGNEIPDELVRALGITQPKAR